MWVSVGVCACLCRNVNIIILSIISFLDSDVEGEMSKEKYRTEQAILNIYLHNKQINQVTFSKYGALTMSLYS